MFKGPPERLKSSRNAAISLSFGSSIKEGLTTGGAFQVSYTPYPGHGGQKYKREARPYKRTEVVLQRKRSFLRVGVLEDPQRS